MTVPALQVLEAPRRALVDTAAWGIPHPRPFLLEIVVGPNELRAGTVEHVTNVRFVRWIDRAAEMHADALGMTRADLRRRDRMWFVSRHEVDYCAEALPDDRIVIATWVRDMGKTRSWRDTLMVRPADGAVVCKAASLWVHMDLARRRPTRIDPATAAAFDPLDVMERRRGAADQPPRESSSCMSS